MFKPTYIYIKTCEHCGLKYLGKTINKNNYYKGSGKYWKRHIRKHNSIIHTSVINYFKEDEEEFCKEFCLMISKFFNIVKSNKWANLIVENGIDGGINIYKGKNLPKSHSNNISMGRKGMKFKDKHKKNISKGKNKGGGIYKNVDGSYRAQIYINRKAERKNSKKREVVEKWLKNKRLF